MAARTAAVGVELVGMHSCDWTQGNEKQGLDIRFGNRDWMVGIGHHGLQGKESQIKNSHMGFNNRA